MQKESEIIIYQAPNGITKIDVKIAQIISQNINLFGNNPSIGKINAGFTNSVYEINEQYILKICTDVENEIAFKKEVDFYLSNKDNPKIPKLYSYSIDKNNTPYFFEIMEKLDGVSLYNIWHSLTESERENIIMQLCDILKAFHSKCGGTYNWSQYMKHHVENYLEKVKETNLLSLDEINLIEGAMTCFDTYLKTDSFVFIHNDIHFDNILYKDGKIKIIDFERSMIAPVDKELDIFFRMIEMPHKYASEETEKYTNIDDYKNIKEYVIKYYPELLNVENLDIRLAIYNLCYDIELYFSYPKEEDLKDRIIKSAQLICNKHSIKN